MPLKISTLAEIIKLIESSNIDLHYCPYDILEFYRLAKDRSIAGKMGCLNPKFLTESASERGGDLAGDLEGTIFSARYLKQNYLRISQENMLVEIYYDLNVNVFAICNLIELKKEEIIKHLKNLKEHPYIRRVAEIYGTTRDLENLENHFFR